MEKFELPRMDVYVIDLRMFLCTRRSPVNDMNGSLVTNITGLHKQGNG